MLLVNSCVARNLITGHKFNQKSDNKNFHPNNKSSQKLFLRLSLKKDKRMNEKKHLIINLINIIIELNHHREESTGIK